MNRSKSPAVYAPIVSNTFLFRNIDPSSVASLLSETEGICVEHCTRGQRIRSIVGAPRALCIIVEGRATVEKRNGDSTLRMSVLEKGDLFGAASMFCDDESYVAEISALTSVWTILIPESSLHALMKREPIIMENYIRYLTGRIRFLSSRIDSLACGGIEERFLLALTNIANHGKCTLDCSMDAFAKSLGVSRATLYRAQEALIKDGRLRKEGKSFYIIPEEEL